MRIFIALELPAKTRDNLCISMSQLGDHTTKGNFTAKENLHVTLHFLGEVSPDKLIFVQSAMDGVKQLPAPTLTINQIGMLRANDIVCAKIRPDKKLAALHEQLGTSLEKLGFTVEHRAFRPHVTLVRKSAFDLPFSEVVKCVDVFNMPFDATQIVLYQSALSPTGPTYTELYRVQLEK